jgi:hypothetical protein
VCFSRKLEQRPATIRSLAIFNKYNEKEMRFYAAIGYTFTLFVVLNANAPASAAFSRIAMLQKHGLCMRWPSAGKSCLRVRFWWAVTGSGQNLSCAEWGGVGLAWSRCGGSDFRRSVVSCAVSTYPGTPGQSGRPVFRSFFGGTIQIPGFSG